MLNNKSISLQLYSLRDDCARDLPATLRAVSDIGYKSVEFAGYFNYSAADLRSMLDDNGLTCAGTHTSLDSVDDNKIQETAEFNAILGNPFLIVPGVGDDYRRSREGAMRLAGKLAQASQTAAEFGARVGYHNHGWEFEPIAGSQDFTMEMLATNTPPEVVLQVDTGNTQEGGADPIAFLEKWKNRVATVHLKPFSKDFERYYIGEDDSDWPGIMSVLQDAPTQFFIVEQERYPEPNTPLDCVRRCFVNLQKMS